MYIVYIAANHSKNRHREKDTAQLGKYLCEEQTIQGVVLVFNNYISKRSFTFFFGLDPNPQ
jgi:hypothetical protein